MPEHTPPMGNAGGSFRRILVGLDGSNDAHRALLTALALTDALRGEAQAVLVVHPPPHVETREELSRAADAERAELLSGIAEARAEMGRETAVPADVLFSDQPAEALAEYAERHGFDLIVVGAHGRGHVTHGGLGRSLEVLLRHHPCPVLVV